MTRLIGVLVAGSALCVLPVALGQGPGEDERGLRSKKPPLFLTPDP